LIDKVITSVDAEAHKQTDIKAPDAGGVTGMRYPRSGYNISENLSCSKDVIHPEAIPENPYLPMGEHGKEIGN